MTKTAQFCWWGLIFCLYFTAGGPAATRAQVTDSAHICWAEIAENPAKSTSPTTTTTAESASDGGERSSFFRRAINLPDKPQALRLALWGGLSVSQGLLAYEHTTKIWGKPNGKFHFKNDLRDDHMALSDEASHLFLAYKLAQVTQLGFRWSGLAPTAAARAGAAQAALYLTFVEFPMDSYNPKQGFGVTDFVANLAGIGLAWYRAGRENPRWDLKASVKSRFFEGDSRLIAHTNRQYDDYIYWLTYRISENRYNPIVMGVGYSTHHPGIGIVDKELYFRIGTSFSEIGRIFGRGVERILSPAEFYFLSVGPQVGWK